MIFIYVIENNMVVVGKRPLVRIKGPKLHAIMVAEEVGHCIFLKIWKNLQRSGTYLLYYASKKNTFEALQNTFYPTSRIAIKESPSKEKKI